MLELRRRRRPEKVEDNSEKSDKGSLRRFFGRYGWQVAVLAFVALLFALPIALSYARKPSIPEVGDIAQEDIIAPISFEVLKDPDSLEAERQAVLRSVPVVLSLRDGVKDSVLAAFDSLWSVTVEVVKSRALSQEQKLDSLASLWPGLGESALELVASLKPRQALDFARVVKAGLRLVYGKGFVSSRLDDEWRGELYRIGSGRRSEVLPAAMVMTDSIALVELAGYFDRQYRSSPERSSLALAVAKRFVVPNLVPDEDETRALRKSALEKISEVKFTVKQGEKIVGKHERITREVRLKLISLYDKLQGRRRVARSFFALLSVFGVLAVSLCVVAMFGAFLWGWYRELWEDLSKFMVAGGAMFAVVVATHLLHASGLTNYAAPVNFVAALLAFLFGEWVAFAASVTMVILCAVGFGGNVVFVVAATLAAAIIAFGTQRVHMRQRLYRPVLYAVVVGAFVVVVFNLILYTPPNDILRYAAEFGISTLFSPFLAFLALPLAERLSGLASDFTLTGLADVNSVLLQKLSVEAPGTFHHSILVGNMAASAAEAVGANAPLARVGGYYHDIGKLVNPEYFDENQTGLNPHDSLSPFESFRVIKEHIREGVEIARLHRFPKPVIDIIQQHHGTSVMEFFYRKAKELQPSVSPDEFRYPGPKPQTREAVIVMICDTIEAAVRSRGEGAFSSPEELKAFVNELVMEKLNDGQFDEAPISMRDIKRVIERSIPMLMGIYHKRVPHEGVPKGA